MKKNKNYLNLDQEEENFEVHEPVVAYASSNVSAAAEVREIPGLPQSWDELQECISAGEEEYERGEAISMENAIQRMRAHVK